MKTFLLIALATVAACVSVTPPGQPSQSDHLVKFGGNPIYPSNIISWKATEYLDGGSLPDGGIDGVNLNGVQGFGICITEVNGNLTGTEVIQDFLYRANVAAWAHNPTLDLTVTNTGTPYQCFPDIVTVIPAGFFKPVVIGPPSSDGGTQAIISVTYVQQ